MSKDVLDQGRDMFRAMAAQGLKTKLSNDGPKDTMDKLDPHSFEVIGDVVMKTIGELEQQK